MRASIVTNLDQKYHGGFPNLWVSFIRCFLDLETAKMFRTLPGLALFDLISKLCSKIYGLQAETEKRY